MKNLILHIGAPKTGSKALQEFFHLNADALKEQGIFYRRDLDPIPEGSLVEGNGSSLLTWCRGRNYEADPNNILESYFNDSDTAICSHEDFFFLEKRGWYRLIELCRENHVLIRIVAVVRNIYDTYQSHYDHYLKYDGEVREFLNFVLQVDVYRLKPFKSLTNMLARDQIHVVHYDSHQNNLVSAFSRAACLDVSAILWQHTLRRINRGLSNKERSRLLMVNRLLGASQAQRLIKFLNGSELEVEQTFFDEQVFELLRKRHAKEVDWVNMNFFEKKEILKICSDKPTSKHLINGCDSEIEFFGWAIRELANKERELLENARTCILKKIAGALTRASQSKYANSQGLPVDFNVCGYLLRNVDVLFSNNDPYDHYLKYGKAEGRVYKLGETVVIRTAGPIHENGLVGVGSEVGSESDRRPVLPIPIRCLRKVDEEGKNS